MRGMLPVRFFSVKACSVVVTLATISSPLLFAEEPQAPATTTAANVIQSAPTEPRKTLPLEQLPVEKKAEILMARGEYAAAITAYEQGNLKSALVWNSIGMAYHHLFALDEARKAYQHALAINPRFSPAANNLAAIYYTQRELGVAEHWYKRALKNTSESAVIYCNLGTAYFAESKYKKGVKAYRKAFSIDPKVFSHEQHAMVEAGSSRAQRIEMNYFVAETYARVGQHEQALISLRKAMDEGFKDRKRLDEDKDFATLRATPEFQHLLEQENLN
jgi:tetratricopeptide (TPR) repeat protein